MIFVMWEVRSRICFSSDIEVFKQEIFFVDFFGPFSLETQGVKYPPEKSVILQWYFLTKMLRQNPALRDCFFFQDSGP